MKVRRVMLVLIIATSCLALLTSCYYIDYYLSRVYKVYGTVTVSGTEPPVPLSSVEVFMGDYQYSELTNYNGDYEMELPEGTWTINFYKDEYEPASAEVTVGSENPRVEQNMSMVWIQPPTPIDLTGYYDWYIKEEEDWWWASILYFLQEDSTLEGSMGFSGYISDSFVHLEAEIEEEGGVTFEIQLNGTVSGDEITGYVIEGDVTYDNEEGEFRLVPSTLPFGHLYLDGEVEVEGEVVEIDLDTEYGYATGGEMGSSSFELSYFDHELDVTLFFNLNQQLAVGNYSMTDQAWVSITYMRDEQGLHEFLFDFNAQGTLIITHYDADGIAGNFTMSKEGTSDYLSGNFNVYFVELWYD